MVVAFKLILMKVSELCAFRVVLGKGCLLAGGRWMDVEQSRGIQFYGETTLLLNCWSLENGECARKCLVLVLPIPQLFCGCPIKIPNSG